MPVDSMHEYDLIADWYARDRIHLTGLPEVQALANVAVTNP